MFVEVANEAEIEATNESSQDQEIKDLQKKVNMSENAASNAAIEATITILQGNKKAEQPSGAPVSEPISMGQGDHQNTNASSDFGIYTFFFNEDHCDYERSKTLEEGQKFYRERTNDSAKIFVAKGEVQR